MVEGIIRNVATKTLGISRVLDQKGKNLMLRDESVQNKIKVKRDYYKACQACKNNVS